MVYRESLQLHLLTEESLKEWAFDRTSELELNAVQVISVIVLKIELAKLDLFIFWEFLNLLKSGEYAVNGKAFVSKHL